MYVRTYLCMYCIYVCMYVCIYVCYHISPPKPFVKCKYVSLNNLYRLAGVHFPKWNTSDLGNATDS